MVFLKDADLIRQKKIMYTILPMSEDVAVNKEWAYKKYT
jgi:hypothetical protein